MHMDQRLSKKSDLRSALAYLIIEDGNFTALEKGLSAYCPFEAVGMVNAEIRHSSFLAHSIDPYRPHNFGAEFLRILLDTILAAIEDPPISRLELHLADFDDVDVRREWRHIDVLVILPGVNLIIALELKIGAREGREQLSRYSRSIEETWPEQDGWRYLKLLLTRSSDLPTDESWHSIDYNLIVDAIKRFESSSVSGSPLAHDTL